jgi:hypothetical protein
MTTLSGCSGSEEYLAEQVPRPPIRRVRWIHFPLTAAGHAGASFGPRPGELTGAAARRATEREPATRAGLVVVVFRPVAQLTFGAAATGTSHALRHPSSMFTISLASIAVVSPQCQALPVRFRNEAAIDAAHFEAELVTIEADRSSVCVGPFAQAERPGYRRVDLGFAREEGEAENEFPVLNPPAAPSFPDTRPRGPVAKAQDKRPVWLQFPDRQRVIGCMPTGGIRPSADKGSLSPRQRCVEDVPANQHSENDE